jgi:hypothetical protein
MLLAVRLVLGRIGLTRRLDTLVFENRDWHNSQALGWTQLPAATPWAPCGDDLRVEIEPRSDRRLTAD